MPSKQSCSETYKKQMSQLNHGDALLEPAPFPYFKRVRPGDVGYIRRGSFNLLFHAGYSPDERRLGVDVPHTFRQLDVGPIFNTEPRLPGYLSTNTVRETPARQRASIYPMLQPGSSISFQLTGDQGAALLTKHPTYREDIQLERTFEEYTKVHYSSWVAFARERGHGSDVKPVLVTGVDLTRDFAMISYSNDDDDNLTAEFTISAPEVASAWGTWRTTGAVYKNCGPVLCRTPSPPQTTNLVSSGNDHMETVSDEYNQCVFIRYYTMRKRLGIPRVIRAAAGPHDLGPGGRGDGESSFEVECDSDSDSDSGLDSDAASSLFDDDGDDGSSVTSIDSEPDVEVIHNTIPDERGDFDVIADYIFQNSDADFVLIHHRDIALLREPGDSTDISTRLLEKQPPIIVDRDGVGMIGRKTDPPADARFNGPLGIDPPAPLFVHGEVEPKPTNRVASPEPQSTQSAPCCIQEITTDPGGSASGFTCDSTVSTWDLTPYLCDVYSSPTALWWEWECPYWDSTYSTDYTAIAPRDLSIIPGDRGNNTYGRAVPISLLPTVARRADVWEHRNPLVSHPADGVGNEETTRPSVESPLDDLPISRCHMELAQNLLSTLSPTCQWFSPGDIKTVGEYPIAAGGFADVWEGTSGDRKVVIKSYRCYKSFDVSQVVMRFQNEIHTHRLLHHGGVEVVPFVGVYSTEEHPFGLIYEYMDHLDLGQYLRHEQHVERLKLLMDISRSLGRMHDLGIVHGNLGIRNVLVDQDGTAHIAGLGGASILSCLAVQTVGRGASTSRFSASHSHAPESTWQDLRDKPDSATYLTKAGDVHAFGVMAWEVITGRPPFPEMTREPAACSMLSGGGPPRQNHYEISDRVWNIIDRCLHDAPSKRMSAGEAASLLRTESKP